MEAQEGHSSADLQGAFQRQLQHFQSSILAIAAQVSGVYIRNILLPMNSP
jgi:hypothetical protein